MAQYNADSARHSFTVSGTPARYVRVIPNGSTSRQMITAGVGDKCIGVTANKVGTSGDPCTIIFATNGGTIPMTASGAITVNSKVYADANGQVTATANGNLEGIALSAASAAGDIIEVYCLRNTSGGALYTQTAAGTALTNSTTETVLSTFTAPANLFAAGDRIRIFAQGIATATNSTDTLKAKLYIGSTAICDTGALDVANNDIYIIEAECVIRTAGANGTIVGAGYGFIGTPGTANTKPFNLASTAIDTTASQVISVKGTWSVANSGDSCRSDIFDISRVLG